MKYGLFFGAGAEISYGLPSGGQFAIDLFRQDTTTYKEKLRNELNKIKNTSRYATQWLPDDYIKKPIYAFSKNEFSSLIESSISYNGNLIADLLNNFDELCEKAIKYLSISESSISNKFQEATNEEFGNVLYNQKIKLNPILSQNATIFSSKYYSAILEVIKTQKNVDDLKRYAIAFLQLLVGAHGYNLAKKLNEELFENTPDDIPIFDDIFGMFRLEFNQVGSTALDLLLNEKRSFEIHDDSDINCILSAISQQVLEYIFIDVLNYQKLIDEHFRYLFSPKTEWAKFTKMVIFLEIARDYIKRQIPETITENGYYNDLVPIKNEISIIGTSNYNNLISKVVPDIDIETIHLNGSVLDFYNPYKNSVSQYDEKPSELNQIEVPFILTQSGLKPLTSVEMSRRYVKLFDEFKQSDAIIIIGFGFNKDDSHINGLFRELIEKHNKKLFIVGISEPNRIKTEAIKNLRVDINTENIIAVSVDKITRSNNGKTWIDIIKDEISSITDTSN